MNTQSKPSIENTCELIQDLFRKHRVDYKTAASALMVMASQYIAMSDLKHKKIIEQFSSLVKDRRKLKNQLDNLKAKNTDTKSITRKANND